METHQQRCGKWLLRLRTPLWQLFLVLLMAFSIDGQIRYSIPEEMKKGSLIGNVAQDLGLDLTRLRSGRARIVSGESNQYTELKADKGILVVNEKIDREQLCGEKSLDRELNPHVSLKLIAVDGGTPQRSGT
ncbi:hypothetical protein CCH79_00020955, partial [Gambusia affinis]